MFASQGRFSPSKKSREISLLGHQVADDLVATCGAKFGDAVQQFPGFQTAEASLKILTGSSPGRRRGNAAWLAG
jgi:hypothetical protein